MDGVGIDQFHHQHQQHLNKGPFAAQQLPLHPLRKRKAEAAPENNERLSKRLSLLNLEQSGQKLYVPVENPISQSSQPATPTTTKKHHYRKPPTTDDTQMQLDDTKHKVYIYNLDDELSSSDNDSDHESKLVFLPDIEKHLRNSRIPSHVLNPRRGAGDELAGGKELVLYRVPSSLSVPEEQDSVRKAIIEARERARERQREQREQQAAPGVSGSVPVPVTMASLPPVGGGMPMDAEPLPGFEEDDPDAMELD